MLVILYLVKPLLFGCIFYIYMKECFYIIDAISMKFGFHKVI